MRTKIKITDFALRHFDRDFGGTKILSITPEQFEEKVNLNMADLSMMFRKIDNHSPQVKFSESPRGEKMELKLMDGYAPFCKLLAIRNFTDAKVGSLPLTLERCQYIRTGYSARKDSELPVMSRWLELPIGKPRAKWLILVLYDKAQIDKEAKEDSFDAEWGAVAILGQSHSNEEPMKPETMLRNALGVEEGGSGVPLDKEQYLKSVNFWTSNLTVK